MFSCTPAQHIYCTNTVQSSVCKWTVLTVITQKLLLYLQLHNSTSHLVYKYCSNCKLSYLTVLTAITQNLLIHVLLHNNKAHLLYNFCTNFTFCNWAVLKLVTQNLLLHVQLHSSTAHLLYNCFAMCTVCPGTAHTIIAQNLLLHVRVHNSTAHLLYKLFSVQLSCTYGNFTKASATYSAAQLHTNCQTDVFWNAVHPVVLNCTYISTYTFSHILISGLSN